MRDRIYFILSMIIFGAIGVFAKFIDLDSSEIALFMSLIGSFFLLTIFICSKHPISRGNIKKNTSALLVSSIALSGNWIFLFQSYKETTIANAALSYYFAPVLVIVMSPVVLKERLSLKKVVCVCTGLLGLICIVLSGGNDGSSHHLLGIFYGLVAAAFYATLTLSNKFIRDLNGLENTLLQLLLSAALLIPYVLLTTGLQLFRISVYSVVLIVVLGVLHTGVGFYLFFSGMKGLKGQSIAVLSYIDPLTSLLISAFVFRERMAAFQIIGAVLLLGSTFISEVRISLQQRKS
ncbi:DMT family transporter [Alicyclobacillus fastidiosus]|uniref:DMT family transporter n=1 Tax=Alicyclobacillus fastidiosus TaxID=392011 RepID=A0ABY6ZFR2_9BACL|nr:DMT family transporter [Alicyclobacillus fastidiosus]WAH41418.1 DMT family transporter [Alicyclobacillus fastidiosus]GMA63041.1 transporter [Alicyclobacillus fastidiosus]